ncbi:MAG TPA: hypothetical protein VHA13_01855 [Gammaproteobacteria bacterium]|nr:hypothetical protein [Gammaproteobacteria bacterium]
MKKKQNASMASTLKNKKANSLAERTEQILLSMPRIIAAQIAKDLQVLKNQESKIKADLKKNELQKKKLTLRLTGLKKASTAAARKQIKVIQSQVKKLTSLTTMFSKGITTIAEQTQALAKKRNKYMALQNQLIAFEKSWNKKTKKGKAKTSSVRNSKTKVTTSESIEAQSTKPSNNLELGNEIDSSQDS